MTSREFVDCIPHPDPESVKGYRLTEEYPLALSDSAVRQRGQQCTIEPWNLPENRILRRVDMCHKMKKYGKLKELGILVAH